MISTTSPKNYFLPEKRAPIEGKIELSIKLKKACPARMADKIKKYISTNSARTFLSWIKNKRLAFNIEMTITRHNDKNSNLKKKGITERYEKPFYDSMVCHTHHKNESFGTRLPVLNHIRQEIRFWQTNERKWIGLSGKCCGIWTYWHR